MLLSRETREGAIGLCAGLLEKTERKQANQEKIMAMLAGRKELANADFREALKVSDRTVIRYLDELEKAGRVEQVGDTGRATTYRQK